MGTSSNGRGYLWSNKNLAGMALAAAGPILAIVGVVAAPIGLAIAVPLYAIGALVVPSRTSAAGDLVIGGIGGDHVLEHGRLVDHVCRRNDHNDTIAHRCCDRDRVVDHPKIVEQRVLLRRAKSCAGAARYDHRPHNLWLERRHNRRG